MSEPPHRPRFDSDPNFRLSPEDIAALDEEGAPPPNLAEAMFEAVHGPQASKAAKTQVDCPHCKGCPLCGDTRMVTPQTAQTYREQHAIEFDLTTDPDEEE